MTASEKAKALGLKNLKQVSEITGRSASTLNAWNRSDPAFLHIVLMGCAAHQLATISNDIND